MSARSEAIELVEEIEVPGRRGAAKHAVEERCVDGAVGGWLAGIGPRLEDTSHRDDVAGLHAAGWQLSLGYGHRKGEDLFLRGWLVVAVSPEGAVEAPVAGVHALFITLNWSPVATLVTAFTRPR